MDHSIGGPKPSQYSDAMARIILARIENDERVDRLTARPDMQSKRTLYNWIKGNPRFGAAWNQMRRDQAYMRRAKIAQREQGAREWAAIRARAEGRKPPAKTGRKSTYAPERGRAFCAKVAQGLTVAEAARRSGLANSAIVYRWLRNHPEFRAAYIAACEEREDRLAFTPTCSPTASTAETSTASSGRWSGWRAGSARCGRMSGGGIEGEPRPLVAKAGHG